MGAGGHVVAWVHSSAGAEPVGPQLVPAHAPLRHLTAFTSGCWLPSLRDHGVKLRVASFHAFPHPG